ncbi:MAG: molybdate ABC transporter substrate-binding protein [Bacteriovoracaceae bacterium]
MKWFYLSIVSFLIFQQIALAYESDLKIFAASSLTNVLEEINQKYKGERKISFNFGASSKLASQITAGAPVDIYFSADSEWMDYLINKNFIEKTTKENLLSNSLVLIVPSDSTEKVESVKDLLKGSYDHIALAEENVPAGKYAREALSKLEVFNSSFLKKIVSAENVRIALTWVAKHEAQAGVVYATDALIEPKVMVALTFPKDSYSKIVYPIGIIKNSKLKKEAEKFISFCKSKKAKEIFSKAGFIIIEH